MTEDRFEEFLAEAAREYNRPPEVPRDLMWKRIQAERRELELKRRRRWRYGRYVRWGVGIAAALVIGIGLGRLSMREVVETTSPVAERATDRGSRSEMAYRMAATQHLYRVETLLTSFRTSSGIDEIEPEFWSSADDLLTSTRLLLDSPAARDPALRSLLEDLELLLAQIAYLSASRDGEEIDLITEGLEQRDVLLRLRTAVDPSQVGA